ncbi:DUF3047 domain-containing protein [Tamilnaduibacter salinus]|nr:DUF3047 domain-containing protein [Tamilnaduibacter salinus]
MKRALTVCFVFVGFMSAPLASETLPRFSSMTDLDDGGSWEPLIFPDIDTHTDYSLVTVGDQTVVRANTDGGASGLIARQRITPGDSLILRWRWKVSNVYDAGDARQKSGDDYPARIYVAFAFQPEKAGFFERAKRATVETLFGEELPGNALNYIWANRVPKGTILPNPFTDTTQMVPVNGGPERVGEWVTIERDVVADYRAAFGEAPPPIIGIGLMTDSDNTGESATAWYGDVEIVEP